MIRVIYILGAGRSGSTMLDIVLGNASGAVSCGELLKFKELSGIPHRVVPGDDRDRFWQGIWGKFSETASNLNWKVFHGHRRFPLLLFGLASSESVRCYQQENAMLFGLVAKAAGRSILIDSSKYPSRALLLSNLQGVEISYVYLRRTLRGVISSFRKQDVEQPSKHFLSLFPCCYPWDGNFA